MNILSLCTQPTQTPCVFDIYWRTGLSIKGRVIATVTDDLGEDARIAAELSVARYLLEDRHVCGNDKSGKGLLLRFSFGAIKKLAKQESDKGHLSPYANFLRTRFLGAGLEIENRKVEWANEECDRDVSELIVSGPVVTTIELGGFGKVELTSHAIERYIERFGVSPSNAWRRMRAWSQQSIRLGKPPNSWRSLIKYPQQAGFAVSQNHDCLIVVAPPKLHGRLPVMVTIYQTNEAIKKDIGKIVKTGDLLPKSTTCSSK